MKGHAGHEHNERCDTLAVREIARLKKQVGREELAAALKAFRNGGGPLELERLELSWKKRVARGGGVV